MIIVTHKENVYDARRGYKEIHVRKCFSDDNVQGLQKHLDELTENEVIIEHY